MTTRRTPLHKLRQLHRRRPAETRAAAGGILGALVDALARHDWIGALLILATAALPVVSTWLKVRQR